MCVMYVNDRLVVHSREFKRTLPWDIFLIQKIQKSDPSAEFIRNPPQSNALRPRPSPSLGSQIQQIWARCVSCRTNVSSLLVQRVFRNPVCWHLVKISTQESRLAICTRQQGTDGKCDVASESLRSLQWLADNVFGPMCAVGDGQRTCNVCG